jgi:hypothetical protein
VKRIRRVAPRTPQIASRQTYENARQARPSAFSLNRFEYFSDEHDFGVRQLCRRFSSASLFLTYCAPESILRLDFRPNHHKTQPSKMTGTNNLQ